MDLNGELDELIKRSCGVVSVTLRDETSINASVNSSSAHPHPGNPVAFAHLVSLGGGEFAIFSRSGGWAFAYPWETPEYLTFHIWFRHLQQVAENRRKGAEKAKVSRLRKANKE